MMKQIKPVIALFFILVILVGGCSKQKQDTAQKEPAETTGQAVDSLDKDLSGIDAIDNESDLGSLDDLDKDLDIGF